MIRSTSAAIVALLGVAVPVTADISPSDRAAGHAARAPTRDGLVLHYAFDSDTGTTARSSTGTALDGRYVGTTAWAVRSSSTAGFGRAITLVGSRSQYVSVPERDPLDVDRFTIAAMIRYTGVQHSSTGGRWEVLEKADAYWMNVRTDGRVRVGGFFGGCTSGAWRYLDSTVVVPVDRWTHVAGTYDGTTLTVWVDGQRAGSRAISGRTCNNDHPLAVGAKDHPAQGLLEAFWDGRLDEVRIYRRALSAAEIRTLRTA